jgi:hypothetical protein
MRNIVEQHVPNPIIDVVLLRSRVFLWRNTTPVATSLRRRHHMTTVDTILWNALCDEYPVTNGVRKRTKHLP